MATLQRRWFCGTCKREWVFARNWQPEDGCPGCRSAAVQLVDFVAARPGLDMPRDPSGVPTGSVLHEAVLRLHHEHDLAVGSDDSPSDVVVRPALALVHKEHR